MWAFYPPVVVYALLLGLRYRGLTLFTLANPGMPHAGIVMMSKRDMLKGFQRREHHVAAFTVISEKLSLDERLARLNHFMQSRNLSFPIALKPNYGERGVGVSIVRSPKAAREYLRGSSETVIAQEYVAGKSAGYSSSVAHFLAGTPRILPTMAPGLIVSVFFCSAYTYRLSVAFAKREA